MKRELTVWLINHYAGNLELGMEYRHFFLARHLTRLGHRVVIVTASFHHLYTKLPPMDGAVTVKAVEGVTFAWLRTPVYRGNGPRRLLNTLVFSARVALQSASLAARLGRPDVVIGSSPHPFVVLNLLDLKRRWRVPIFFEVRDLWPQMLIDLGSLSPRHPLTRLFLWLEELGYRRADRVLSLWHSAYEYMFAHGLDPSRYVYLPNGIELEQPDAPDDTHPLLQRVRELKKAGRFVVGYAGSHGLANPLDSIADACRRLRERGVDDVDFFLVGDGPSKAALVARAARERLANLHFHDYVTKDVIMAFYREIDVAFMGLRDLPLFRYGPTPNKLMDYLVAGKPIIYAIRSSFDPVAEVGAGETIPPDDPDALVDAILKLRARTPEALAAMGEAGRQYAIRELDFAALARRLESVLLECTHR
jgi:glycosyltransferase involved in cell wall biosynthesis